MISIVTFNKGKYFLKMQTVIYVFRAL